MKNLEYGNEVLYHSKGLTSTQFNFMRELLNNGCEIELFYSDSEVVFSKGYLWIGQHDCEHYYADIFDTCLKAGKVAMILKNRILDIDIWSSDSDDKEQIKEEKARISEAA